MQERSGTTWRPQRRPWRVAHYEHYRTTDAKDTEAMKSAIVAGRVTSKKVWPSSGLFEGTIDYTKLRIFDATESGQRVRSEAGVHHASMAGIGYSTPLAMNRSRSSCTHAASRTSRGGQGCRVSGLSDGPDREPI